MRQNSAQGATAMEVVVGSISITGVSSATTANISVLAGKTLAYDCYVVATVLNVNGGAANDVDVQGISAQGALTFTVDAAGNEEDYIMYHVWYYTPG